MNDKQLTGNLAALGGNRRSFVKKLGIAGAVLGAVAESNVAKGQSTTSTGYTDFDIVNFALNLEYLEAEYYLRAGGELARTAPASAAEPDSFVYRPSDPTPSVGGPLLQGPGKQADNTALEARPDVLTYTSEPLAADTDLAGPVSARIFVRTGRAQADLFVRVCDVGPDGVSLNVVDGIRRLSPETVPGPDAEPGDDGVLAVEVELFPTAYRVRAGHRLRVQVSGGAFPRFARNLGNGEPFGSATTARQCQFEIFRDAAHPSLVRLPVLVRP